MARRRYMNGQRRHPSHIDKSSPFNKGWDVNRALDKVQDTLTVGGIFFDAADIINAGISGGRAIHARITGDKEKAKEYAGDAALNITSAIPIVGTGPAIAKGIDMAKDFKQSYDVGKSAVNTVKENKDIFNKDSKGRSNAKIENPDPENILISKNTLTPKNLKENPVIKNPNKKTELVPSLSNLAGLT
jgi:hypothetical protein